jgi:hypothetical protein
MLIIRNVTDVVFTSGPTTSVLYFQENSIFISIDYERFLSQTLVVICQEYLTLINLYIFNTVSNKTKKYFFYLIWISEIFFILIHILISLLS